MTEMPAGRASADGNSPAPLIPAAVEFAEILGRMLCQEWIQQHSPCQPVEDADGVGALDRPTGADLVESA